MGRSVFQRFIKSGFLSNGDIHFLLIILDHGDLILVNVAVVRHPVHDVEDYVGHGQVYAQLVGVVLGIENILAVDSDSGAGFIIDRKSVV